MANQTGVVTTELPSAGKAVYVKGGGVISSEDFQTANVAEGQCILFDYSIDYGAAENADGGASLGYMTATIYDNTITTVDRWPLHSVLSDTSRALPSEQLLSGLQARTAYIRGMLFLFTEIADHPTVQQDSFGLGGGRVDDYPLRVQHRQLCRQRGAGKWDGRGEFPRQLCRFVRAGFAFGELRRDGRPDGERQRAGVNR